MLTQTTDGLGAIGGRRKTESAYAKVPRYTRIVVASNQALY